ncbi:DNA cytosine methyltransferase [Sphingomonas sp. 37zxx]|uniref:DNA cytosine methyltransferase n=1 Tax=Sphingomonas sp. 37zxx TaxID=1550073 RepID=UPI00053BE736|nr:DNA cytosine methyltransferase [Sphingomonas sp. 37zxx]
MTEPRTFYEFFAGGGMARAGLGSDWQCVFANDFSEMKAKVYTDNWGAGHFHPGDIAAVSTENLPGRADLAWASFPCQDLSLAGGMRGLGDASATAATRSGTFWPFWSLMTKLQDDKRGPRVIVLENVVGAITSKQGRDFEAICRVLADAKYRFGAMVVDAKWFLPQSRPRLFFVAIAQDQFVPGHVIHAEHDPLWHPASLRAAVGQLPKASRKQWLWWKLPQPSARKLGLADLIEDEPTGCAWHSPQQTKQLLAMMAPLHQQKLEAARATGAKRVGGVYKRTRLDHAGVKRQRAEVRFDDIAGCLRTPAGGSSRQLIIVVEGRTTRSRLLSPREAARLMGLSDQYRLPDRYNDAYHVAGDGVCVPVVRHLERHLLSEILAANERGALASAA